MVALLGLLLCCESSPAQEKKPPAIVPAEKLPEGWDEIDQRLVFLMVKLANVETSLEAVEKALSGGSSQQAKKTSEAKRAEDANEKMNQKGGGPAHWSVFYGRTAEKFFYHPTDRNSTYHTTTVLSPQPPANDNQTAPGIPSRQGLPVHQRPPQFDYIYRSNETTKARAEQEIAKLRNKQEALQDRRQRLELEQSALWCEIAFRAVAHFDLHKKPLLRFEPLADAADRESKQRAEVLKTAAGFLRVSLSIIDAAEKDQTRTFRTIKATVSTARDKLDDAWLLQGVDVTDKKSTEGKFAALAKRLNDIASNLSDSHQAAAEGDREKDQLRKDAFRGLLQESLINYAQVVLALNEMFGVMIDAGKYKPDLEKPVAVLILVKDPLEDAYQENTTWVSDDKKFTLIVLKRDGESFRARFILGERDIREINGVFRDGKVSWLGKDVRQSSGTPTSDHEGTIARDSTGVRIDFVWKRDQGGGGTFTLRLLK